MNITEIPVMPRQNNQDLHKEPAIVPGDISALLEVCNICCLPLNPKDVDRKFMKETNTWQVVCKDCAKLFTNYKGDK